MKKFVYINIESYEIPSNIDELIIFLEEKVKETGAPRDEVGIEISAESDYGGYKAVLSFSFEREETEKEKLKRAEDQKTKDNWDREMFERLKKKFEEGSV